MVSNLDLSTTTEADFEAAALALLDRVSVVAGGRHLRLREIEMYLHSTEHPDPFTHRASDQSKAERWYFHRAGAGFRGGSFKGLDITFGPAGSSGGILLRSAGLAGDDVVSGPSLLVDRLLALTGHDRVADLHEAIAGRSVWDTSSPLHLIRAAHPPLPVLRSARVGLTLKRAADHPAMPDYIDRLYRFLNAPRAIRKGRDLLVRALSAGGATDAEIHALTGATPSAIERWLTTSRRE